ncbi:MAG: hypothetical protein KAT71_06260 [Gammaproteobacteria bacterium]|nr:hypothetical protein [Gammaproteobacteria bacterium]
MQRRLRSLSAGAAALLRPTPAPPPAQQAPLLDSDMQLAMERQNLIKTVLTKVEKIKPATEEIDKAYTRSSLKIRILLKIIQGAITAPVDISYPIIKPTLKLLAIFTSDAERAILNAHNLPLPTDIPPHYKQQPNAIINSKIFYLMQLANLGQDSDDFYSQHMTSLNLLFQDIPGTDKSDIETAMLLMNLVGTTVLEPEKYTPEQLTPERIVQPIIRRREQVAALHYELSSADSAIASKYTVALNDPTITLPQLDKLQKKISQDIIQEQIMPVDQYCERELRDIIVRSVPTSTKFRHQEYFSALQGQIAASITEDPKNPTRTTKRISGNYQQAFKKQSLFELSKQLSPETQRDIQKTKNLVAAFTNIISTQAQANSKATIDTDRQLLLTVYRENLALEQKLSNISNIIENIQTAQEVPTTLQQIRNIIILHHVNHLETLTKIVGLINQPPQQNLSLFTAILKLLKINAENLLDPNYTSFNDYIEHIDIINTLNSILFADPDFIRFSSILKDSKLLLQQQKAIIEEANTCGEQAKQQLRTITGTLIRSCSQKLDPIDTPKINKLNVHSVAVAEKASSILQELKRLNPLFEPEYQHTSFNEWITIFKGILSAIDTSLSYFNASATIIATVTTLTQAVAQYETDYNQKIAPLTEAEKQLTALQLQAQQIPDTLIYDLLLRLGWISDSPVQEDFHNPTTTLCQLSGLKLHMGDEPMFHTAERLATLVEAMLQVLLITTDRLGVNALKFLEPFNQHTEKLAQLATSLEEALQQKIHASHASAVKLSQAAIRRSLSFFNAPEEEQGKPDAAATTITVAEPPPRSNTPS